MGLNVSEYGWYPINFLISVTMPQKEISTVLKDHLAQSAYFPYIFIMVTFDSKSLLWLFQENAFSPIHFWAWDHLSADSPVAATIPLIIPLNVSNLIKW